MSFGGAKKTNSQDKLIENILEDTKEVAQLINQFVEEQNVVKKGELVRYNNSYITKKYQSKEANLIYKLKNQEIFFLIEHRSSVDNNIQFKMMNYCLDIMREWSKNQKIRKNTEYPIIVPIVTYTGNQEWKIPEDIEEQVEDYTYEDYKVNLQFNLININEIPTKQLLESGSMIGYAMYLEKAQTKEELVESLKVVIRLASGTNQLKHVRKYRKRTLK